MKTKTGNQLPKMRHTSRCRACVYRRAGKTAVNFDNSPLPARYQASQRLTSEAVRLSTENKYGSMKPRPRLVRASIARGIIDDDSGRATVVDAEKNKVEYNGETTSLSPLAEKLRNVSAIQGASVFTYNGKKITDIAEETQWKEE